VGMCRGFKRGLFRFMLFLFVLYKGMPWRRVSRSMELRGYEWRFCRANGSLLICVSLIILMLTKKKPVTTSRIRMGL